MADTWHRCELCGARYRSRRAAMRCCSDRFDDDDAPGPGMGRSYPDVHGALWPDGGQETVLVCPACDDCNIYTRASDQFDRSERHLCRACGHTFAEPHCRPAEGVSVRHSAPARALIEADPDAIPDGGVPDASTMEVSDDE